MELNVKMMAIWRRYCNANQRITRLMLVLVIAGTSLCAYAEPAWQWAPEHPVGSPLPQFRLENHEGIASSIAELMGTNGTLLFFNRSTDW